MKFDRTSQHISNTLKVVKDRYNHDKYFRNLIDIYNEKNFI